MSSESGNNTPIETNGASYKKSGVDLEEAGRATSQIGKWVKSTFNAQVLGKWGQFGGCFAPDFSNFEQPVLVSSTDSVGTKLLVAIQAGIHETVGQDIVNHCVNDILTCGAVPLFFLDYIGIGTLDANVVEQIVKGVAIACKENDCVLIGGEMAEMPDVYRKEDYDLVGTIVGIVDKKRLIDGSGFVDGDVLIGFPSTGLHTNGYTLARKVLLDNAGYKLDDTVPDLPDTIGDRLLRIHRSYLNVVKPLIQSIPLKGMAHITGGGLEGNISRIIPDGLTAVIDWTAWTVPPIFSLIQRHGEISLNEMRRVFNMGIGYVVGCGAAHEDELINIAKSMGELPIVIGKIANT